VTPRRVESSLLVVEDFKDANGYEWRVGDVAPLARSAVRQAARERPGRFRVEHETLPFDPDAEWFRAIVKTHETRYAEAKRQRDEAEERRQKALREELKQQEKGQPDLERRYKQQEREREKQAQQAREAIEREQIERELEVNLGPPGFHS
jgi:predicted RNase H-like nuclease (RuvC/YqgF family)